MLALLMVRQKRQAGHLNETVQASLDAMHQEIQSISHGSMGVGRKTLALEKHIAELEAKIEEIQKNDPAKVSYSEAARLVELGAGVDDLMNTCGISRPEAELVKALTVQNRSRADESVPVLNPVH